MTALTLAANHDVAGAWVIVAAVIAICAWSIAVNLRGQR